MIASLHDRKTTPRLSRSSTFMATIKGQTFLLMLGWSAAIALSLAWNLLEARREVLVQAQTEARAAFNKDLLYRRWAAGHGGVYAPVTDETPPNPYLSHIDERDIETPSGRRLTLINPAYMTRQVFELGVQQYGVRGHITSLDPIRMENAPDPWEREALEAFAHGETEVSAVAEIDGESFMRLMRPMVTEKGCLKCHAAQGYQEGDIRGGISISVPMTPYQASMLSHLQPLIGGHAVLWLLGIAGLGLGARSLLRRDRARTEVKQQLLESEQHLREIYAAADNVALVTTDLGGADTRILDFSPGAEQLFRYSRDEVIGKHVAMLHPPEVVKDFPAMQEALRTGRKGYSGEAVLVRKGGETFPALFTVHPRFDAAGELVGTVGVSVDITQRKTLEETMRRLVEVSSRRYGESLFESMALELARTLKADYTLIGELHGEETRSVRTVAAVADGELVDSFEYDLTGTPCENVMDRGKCSYPSNVADLFPEDVLLRQMATQGYVGVPLFSSSGAALGIMVALYRSQLANSDLAESILQIFSARVASEIERMRSEEALRERDQQYHSMLQSTMDGFMVMDRQGNILDVNETYCRMLGYERRELLAMAISDFEGLEHFEETKHHRQRIIDTGHDRFETCHRGKDGVLLEVEVNVTYLADLGGRFYAFVRDLSERKQAEAERARLEEQYHHAQKMEALGQLTGGVAHDFNNLLQVISGNTDLARLDLEAAHPAHEALAEVTRAGERAARLVSQLLLFSRRQIMQPEHLNLNEAVTDLLKMLGRVIGEHVHLRWHPATQLGVIHADRGMIEQALVNLCVNARDAMPDGGTLTIETREEVIDEAYCATHSEARPGRYALLSVSDTGCGMDRELLERVFEPFFTTKERGKGTGLGLATVYGIVKQHDGLVEVYSEPDHGTVFKLYWPVSETVPQQVPSVEEAPVEGGTETILLAEDDEMVRNLARRILEREGYTVLAAENGTEAVALFEEHGTEIDLAILDVVMPGMGGREAYERMRTVQPGLRALFASGYSEDAIHTNFVLDQGLTLIQKPFFRKPLLRAVREVLNQPD
jgi:PAS domain S-box-containing protein